MDKDIEASVTRRKKNKAVWLVLLFTGIIVIAVMVLRGSFASSLNKSAITTAVVEMGNIENTINASGEILPEFEEIITSPIAASIQNVNVDAGAAVKSGESVLALDKSASQMEYEKQKFGLESKQNDIRKLKLELDKSFYDIKSNNSIKQLRINSLEADVENAKRLYKSGGGTREDVEKAELNLKVARLEKEQLENEIKSKQQTMQVQMREASIAAAIQQNNLNELGRKLQLANIVAKREGVVTWINKNIGATVQEGESLARIADLSSFKVQGSISDTYLDQLRNGMTAIIRINEAQVRGTVINIQPSVQNGIVMFNIRLDKQDPALLRPNMKVDVFLVTASKNNVMRVANGPAFKGTASQNIFVLQHNKAQRRLVQTGLANFDFVEIKNNEKPGDIIITSDMSEFKNSNEITINK